MYIYIFYIYIYMYTCTSLYTHVHHYQSSITVYSSIGFIQVLNGSSLHYSKP